MVNLPADPIQVNPGQPATVLPALPHPPQVIAQGLAAQGDLVLLGYDHLPPGQSTDYSLTGYHGLYLTDGPATFRERLDGRSYQGPRAGTIALIPAEVNHQTAWDQAISPRLLFLSTAFVEGAALDQVVGNTLELIPSFCFDDPCLYHLVKALQQDLQQPTHQQTSTLYQEHLALTLVAYLLEHYACCRIKPLPQPGGLDQTQLRQLTDYIEAYLYEPLQLSVLAELVGLSPLELDRGFQKTTGMPLHHYLQHRYQARAYQLLNRLMVDGVNPLLGDRPTERGYPSSRAITTTLVMAQHLNDLVLTQTGMSLNNNQLRILSGTLEGRSYRQIAQEAKVSETYLKKVAADLWQRLSPILGQPVAKSNLRSCLESMSHANNMAHVSNT
jgi:AraC family transcriptional regulator